MGMLSAVRKRLTDRDRTLSECRHCGTNLATTTTECTTCGSHEIAQYDF
ncbi:hypothetical protein [Natronoglomus mannanivorans]|uniref:Small CPxCG-related zinc finger protein n=1 Tax=Natronoglomus mannanivorans TaxID=2979990 RepID=A0AAP2Z4Z2_9EURY|nr:hypothetical protein [Halobacteria archaeon AArc-xg1-1]